MFNAIKYTQELEKAGFTRQQAEVSLMLLIDAMNENFATKSDLKTLGFELDTKIQSLENRIQTLELKMDAKFMEVDAKFLEFEHRIVLKLGTLMVTLMTVLFALIKLVPAA